MFNTNFHTTPLKMTYIDLNLKEATKENETNRDFISKTLNEIILDHKIVIVLGSPGSGKTSILEKFSHENQNTQFVPINKFLRASFAINNNTEHLLLDGLDEYKSTQSDKNSVINDVADKIKEIGVNKAVITCRQSDWFGASESKSLSNALNTEVKIFRILKLDKDKKSEFAHLYKVEKADEFIEKFDSYGFLENPQMFKMIAELYKSPSNKDLNNKTSLYLQFIKHAAEKNEVYINNGLNEIEENELIKLTGFLALFNIFSNIQDLNSDFIKQISSKDKGFELNTLRTAIKTSLFSDDQFIHRTISEFSAAYFIKHFKYKNSEGLDIERIKSIFTSEGKIPTSLKGTFSWLCSLTKNKQLFDLDPFYLLLNGDCDTFSQNEKTTLLESIKMLSYRNPNFVVAGDYYGCDLSNFYQEELDTYLLKTIKKLKSINSEFELLIYKIICSSDSLSPLLTKKLKNQILNEEIHNNIRYKLIEVFKNDHTTLLSVLKKIEQHKIKHDDGVIDKLLDHLYPQTINGPQIVKYLLLYTEKVIGHHRYLYQAKNKDKHAVVESIFEEIFQKQPTNLNLLNFLKNFINDYLLETLLEFEKSLSTEDIYKIFSNLQRYEPNHGFFKTHFTPSSYRHELSVDNKINQSKLQNLANSLFDLFVEKK